MASDILKNVDNISIDKMYNIEFEYYIYKIRKIEEKIEKEKQKNNNEN